MKRLFQVVLWGLPLFVLSSPLFAQTNPTVSQSSPPAGITSTGEFTDVPNKSQQAVAWRLTFWGPSTLTSVEMEIDCAPDDGSGAPGTYAAMTGVYDGTTNPVTVAAAPFAGTIAAKQYCPHVAVNVVGIAGTGSVHFLLLGYSGTSAAASSGGGGGTCPGFSSDGQLLFNQTGNCAGSPAFTVDYANGFMNVTGAADNQILTVTAPLSGDAVNGIAADTDSNDGAAGLNGQATETDSTGGGAQVLGVVASSILNGTNVASDSAIGVLVRAQNTGVGNAGDIAGVATIITNSGTVSNLYGLNAATPSIGTVNGIAAAFAADTGWPYSFYSADGFNADSTGAVHANQVLAKGAESTLNVSGTVYPMTIHAHDSEPVSGPPQAIQIGAGMHSDNGGLSPTMYFNRSEGLESAQTVVQAGDGLGFLAWLGYDGSVYQPAAFFFCQAAGTPGPGTVPGACFLGTESQGGGGPSVALSVDQNQLVAIGSNFQNASNTFTNLAALLTADGQQVYCSDCQVTSPLDNTCVSGGGGAMVFRIASALKCLQ